MAQQEMCGVLLPHHDPYLVLGSFISPHCLRKDGHDGYADDEHLILTEEGEMVVWQTEHCPDCSDPDCEEIIECFVHWKVSWFEAAHLLCWGIDCPDAPPASP